jgi:hypothetical protein
MTVNCSRMNGRTNRVLRRSSCSLDTLWCVHPSGSSLDRLPEPPPIEFVNFALHYPHRSAAGPHLINDSTWDLFSCDAWAVQRLRLLALFLLSALLFLSSVQRTCEKASSADFNRRHPDRRHSRGNCFESRRGVLVALARHLFKIFWGLFHGTRGLESRPKSTSCVAPTGIPLPIGTWWSMYNVHWDW